MTRAFSSLSLLVGSLTIVRKRLVLSGLATQVVGNTNDPERDPEETACLHGSDCHKLTTTLR